MGAETWTATRGEFERLRDLAPAERERRLGELDVARARELRALLAADAEDDALLDTDAPALQEAWSRQRESAPPSEIAGYRVVAKLGEGGSATVYRAEGERTVAIKVLKHDACSPGLAKRFEHERATLAGLEHPGLLRVLGAGHLDDGRPYLVTELVEGEPIDAFCARHELALDARLRLVIDVCRAVHHAHRHLVVHRDLKPANILVGADARPKVLDFGVAKLLDPARDPAWTEHFGRGPLTLRYASPEQVAGGAITTASDVYSLGVLLFELVAGASPYAESNDRAAIERAVAEGRRRPIDEVARANGRPLPPRDVAAIVERALAVRPDERYASAEHFAQDLTCFLEGRPLLSHSEPWSRRVARFARRRPWLVALAAAVLCVAIGSWIGTRRSLARVVASEGVAWRAHANAVRSTDLLADLLASIGASSVGDEELARHVAETERSVADLADQPEAEARLRMALARLERARGAPASAETHFARALELSRNTRGLSWQTTDACLAALVELRAARGDASAVELARERVDLLRARGATELASEAQRALEQLEARASQR